MSLWSQVEPFCREIPYKESFRALIDSKKYGYFSKKAQGVSGYYESKFILIVRQLLKRKDQCSKKVCLAVLIEPESRSVSERVFKRSIHMEAAVKKIIDSIHLHAELEKEFPDAVVKAPFILGLFAKTKETRDYVRMDTMEERYPSTLSRKHVLKGKISLGAAVQGLYKIAVALEALHNKGYIHGDIKNWNVFVIDSQLKLFDFDLAHDVPKVTFINNRYEFWDHLSNEIGFRHPFCDVFGWTILLAQAMWGSKFHTILKKYRKDPQLISHINELYFANFAECRNKDFYMTAYFFILNVFVKNVHAFNQAVPYYQAALSSRRRPEEITEGVHNITRIILPTMRHCIEFIHPWVSHLSQAT